MQRTNRAISKAKIQCPGYVAIKEGIDPIMLALFNLKPQQMYVFSMKGWDLQKDGSEVYYINGLGTWIPSSYFDVINGPVPN